MKISVGILGATGIIGEEYIRLLNHHPWFDLTFLAGSEKRVGTTSKIGLPLHSLDDIESAKSKCTFLFSALPQHIADVVEEKYADAGLNLLSHASCHRLKPDIPLIIPEINSDHLSLIDVQRKKRKGFIIAKPNCAINSFLFPIAPLHKAFQVEKVSVTTMQAISGAGLTTLSAMEIFDNVIPYIAHEEEKLELEPLKILGSKSMTISAHCNRVPTLYGHFACTSIALSKKVSRDDILECWRHFKGLDLPSAPHQPLFYCDEPTRPQTRYDLYYEKGMGITVGRLRECPLFDFRFVGFSHNSLRGGAGGGLIIAELLYQKGLL